MLENTHSMAMVTTEKNNIISHLGKAFMNVIFE
jgi:hypothetical protein